MSIIFEEKNKENMPLLLRNLSCEWEHKIWSTIEGFITGHQVHGGIYGNCVFKWTTWKNPLACGMRENRLADVS